MRLVLMLVLLLIASPALAAEGSLVGFGTQTRIPVWKSAQAQDEGQALLRAKADAPLWLPLLSCIAEPGTRVVIAGADPGLYRRPVVLLDGPTKGCRGVVAKENVQERATASPAR